jgi:hypothetical protein
MSCRMHPEIDSSGGRSYEQGLLGHIGASAQAEAETGLRSGGRGIPGGMDRTVGAAGAVGHWWRNRKK